MKRLLFSLALLTLFLLTSQTSFADVDFKWHFGAKVGAGFTGADVTNNTDSTSQGVFFNKFSFAGGLFFNVSHVKFVRIQIEAMYLKKGFNRNGYTADLDYISFPFLVRFQFPIGLFINAGFGITTIIDGKITNGGVTTTNYSDYIDPLEYDIQAGLGWEFKLFDKGSILVEYRLTYSLSNISDSQRYPETINHITNHVYIGFQY